MAFVYIVKSGFDVIITSIGGSSGHEHFVEVGINLDDNVTINEGKDWTYPAYHEDRKLRVKPIAGRGIPCLHREKSKRVYIDEQTNFRKYIIEYIVEIEDKPDGGDFNDNIVKIEMIKVLNCASDEKEALNYEPLTG
jgi:hypothetical protein